MSLPKPYYEAEGVTVHQGDCLDVLATMDEASVDAVCTDPPYDLTAGKKGGTGVASVNLDSPYGRARIGTGGGSGGFMGKAWDSTGVAFDSATWAAVLRVMKPGAHLVAFGGSRTYHRMVCAIEDAGFEIRDCLAWLYGSGFPKSLDVSKAIDKAAGVEREVVGRYSIPSDSAAGNAGKSLGGDVAGSFGLPAGDGRDITAPATPEAQQWDGWGTALKPAHEPIVLARKPLAGTVAGDVLEHGTGALNVDGCRVSYDPETLARREAWHDAYGGREYAPNEIYGKGLGGPIARPDPAGRWPANVVLDPEAAAMLDAQAPSTGSFLSPGSRYPNEARPAKNAYGDHTAHDTFAVDALGGASRFFYTAKASKHDRGEGNNHPTVKPVDLMRWLVRLVTPPGGTVLDPFAGSGTTGVACVIEGFPAILIEREDEYVEIIRKRLSRPIEPVLFGGAA